MYVDDIGLVLNFIHHFWPDLVKGNEFVTQFQTPIVKVLDAHLFYTPESH